MRFVVVGCGSIGERHISNLKLLYPNNDIFVTDASAERLSFIARKYNVEACNTFEEGLKKQVDATFVCTPPSSHVALALQAVKNNSHVFIEKPLSNSANGIDLLIKKARISNLSIFVGYCFRFHPGLEIAKRLLTTGELGKVLLIEAEYGQYLPDWHPGQNYKQSYTAKKELGGGIILDGSHEIDYTRWLVGPIEKVFCFASQPETSLEVETESVACILLKFANGCIGTLHLDFVRKDYSRSCKIICEKGTIDWSFQNDSLKVYRKDINHWTKYDNLLPDVNKIYQREIENFVLSIEREEPPFIGAEEGLKTLQVALAALESSEKGEVIEI
ncbi:MAG: Gfo/Idh/MocA family oxidoreductase [Candidatus Bathyarchaeia archaeon]|jgi:predicted dehydrogenase